MHSTCLLRACKNERTGKELEGWSERNRGERWKEDAQIKLLGGITADSCWNVGVCFHVYSNCAHTQFRAAVSDWRHRDGGLRVFVSLLIKCAHSDKHSSLPSESSLLAYPQFLLHFPPFFLHVIIMDCVRIFNEFIWMTSTFSGSLVHTFIACQRSAEAPLYHLSGLLFISSTQFWPFQHTVVQCKP